MQVSETIIKAEGKESCNQSITRINSHLLMTKGKKNRKELCPGRGLVTHQLLFSCSIQYTTSCSRSRADLMGSNFAFSCSSIGNTCVTASMAAFELETK